MINKPRPIIPLIASLLFLAGISCTVSKSPLLTMKNEKDGTSSVIWESKSGHKIRINAPHLTLEDQKNKTILPLEVTLKKYSVKKSPAILEYTLSLNENGIKVDGTGIVILKLSRQQDEDVLVSHVSLKFSEPVHADVTTEYAFDLMGNPPGEVIIPERSGILRTSSFPEGKITGGCFALGQAAHDSTLLGMPVIGFAWNDTEGLQLAVSADPYCGSLIRGEKVMDDSKPSTRITVSAVYSGSIVPLKEEQRTFALEFHHRGCDGTLRSFYRTIPEIEQGADWTQGIHLVYYDWLSDKGEGWFKDLQMLADRIPPKYRGHVAVCMHGWYDYFQQYAYNHDKDELLKEWIAFPGTHKVPMNLAEMHRRLKFAKDLGYRVLLYFADGTNSDSGSPNFHKEYVLKDKDGNTFPGWKGQDSVGAPLKMDPSVPELRKWYCDYLNALLREYAKDLDGFVWDETFYIKPDFISYGDMGPAYADRAMMLLVSELTQKVQSYHDKNPDLVFLASDMAETSYALVANGTYQDSGMREEAWGPSMFSNYRNSLWSCNWTPIKESIKLNQIAAEKYGIAQGVSCYSNGWEGNSGTDRMPQDLLADIVKRFKENVDSGRERLRFLTP